MLLESEALGTPVVSTAIMGTREVLSAGEGCLIAEDDEADFAAKCVRLLTDPDLRAALSASAVRYARGWSSTAMAGRMLDLYARVIDGDARATAAQSALGTPGPGGSRSELIPESEPKPKDLADSESDDGHGQADARPIEQRKQRRALP